VRQTRYFDKKTDFLYLTWLVSSSTGVTVSLSNCSL